MKYMKYMIIAHYDDESRFKEIKSARIYQLIS